MSMLLDTNVLSETVRARPNAHVMRWLGAHPSFAISAITLEELSFGIERISGKRRTLLYEWFERLRADPAPLIVPVDGEIALEGMLRKHGRHLDAQAEPRGLRRASLSHLDFKCTRPSLSRVR